MHVKIIRVRVFNPFAWPRPGGTNIQPSFPLRLRAIAVSFSLRPLRIPQPCRWSYESQRASSSFTLAIRVVAVVIGLIARLSAMLGATWVH